MLENLKGFIDGNYAVVLWRSGVPEYNIRVYSVVTWKDEKKET